MKKVAYMIETQNHTEKPKNVGAVRSKMKFCQAPISKLAESLMKGQTLACGVLNAGQTSLNWRSQQVFALDFDNNYDHNLIIQRLSNYGIKPSFAYTTFSDSPECHKFRVMLTSNTSIVVPAVCKAIIKALHVICPECDKTCKDLARLTFGGKSIIYEDYEATFNPITLLTESMPQYLKDTDNNNYNHNLNSYCSDSGLNVCNNLPDVRPLYEDLERHESSDSSKIYEIRTTSIIYNIELDANSYKNETLSIATANKVPTDIDWAALHSNDFYGHVYYQDSATLQFYDFNFAKPDKITINKKGESKIKYKPEKRKVTTNRSDLIRNFDFDSLKDNCQLYRDILNGNYWATHDDILTIASNFACIDGGLDEYEELFETMIGFNNRSESYTEPQYNNYLNKAVYCKQIGYAPVSCSYACPFKDTCQNAGKNMLSAVPKKINNKIRKLDDSNIEYKDLADAEEDTREAIIEACRAKDNKIHVIKAPTGIGKTAIYTQDVNLDNICIAVPTHKLLNEVYGRILDTANVCRTYKFDSSSVTLNNKYEQLQKVSAYCSFNTLTTEAKNTGNADIIEYVQDFIKNKEAIKNANTVLTTHAGMLYLENNNIDTYLIDEDITATLLPIQEYKPEDINLVIRELIHTYGSQDDTVRQLRSLEDTIAAMPTDTYFQFPKLKISDTKKLSSCITSQAQYLSTNIQDVLTSDYLIKTINNGKETILTIKSKLSKLHENKTYIILSATADYDMCKYLYKDRLVFTDIGNVKIDSEQDSSTGTIKQWCDYSFSRTTIKNDVSKVIDYITAKIPEINKDINLITFANTKQLFADNGFNNCICHFSACSGIDSYGGQDLLIVGTPHISKDAYMLYALVLGKNISSFDCDDSQLRKRNVKRNAYEFTFMTFEDKFLQTIQLWSIEQELYQAIGRARALRNNCNVYVFSNLPLINSLIQ